MTRLGWLLAAAALLTACSDDSEPAAAPASTAPSASAAGTAGPSAPALARRCVNADAGYAVRYPADWFVEDKPEIEPCAFFDDEPLDVPPRSEALGVAIRVDVRDVLIAQARQDALSGGEKEAEEAEAAGRRAVRITGTLPEEVLLPAGTRITSWLIELDGRTLILTADDAGARDYEAAVDVLDQMAESVELL